MENMEFLKEWYEGAREAQKERIHLTLNLM